MPTTIRPTSDKTTDGDFVHTTQEMAEEDDHRNVSKSWYEKTMSIDAEIERRATTRHERESITKRIGQLRPVDIAGRFSVAFGDRVVFPSEYAVGQLGTHLEIGASYPKKLLRSKAPGAAEDLVYAFEKAIDRCDSERQVTLRVHGDEQLRAILPAGTRYLRNDWYLGILKNALPGSRLSHWRGDDYTIYGNVLIPDSIREEDDSAYGAMVSISNCEIGKRRFEQRPSLFRAICMNGCIWGQTKGTHLTVSRRQGIELREIEKLIVSNVQDQIPIALAGLERFLLTRSFDSNASMKPVIAQIAKEFKLTKALASSVLQGWWEERRETPDLSNTLFAVANAVTRAGQNESNDVWVRFDELGGRLAQMDRREWEDLVSRASRLRAAQVDRAFARWSLSA